MRKIYYNVMRFRNTLSVDEAEVLARRRFSSVSERHYVLHNPSLLRFIGMISLHRER
jgi:hypothetical protein